MAPIVSLPIRDPAPQRAHESIRFWIPLLQLLIGEGIELVTVRRSFGVPSLGHILLHQRRCGVHSISLFLLPLTLLQSGQDTVG